MKFFRFLYCIGYPMVGLVHADKDGSPVLHGGTSRRTVNGVYFNHPKTGFVCFAFRRVN